MFCTKCGKQLSDDSNFCVGCGYKIDSDLQIAIKNSAQIANRQPSTLLMSATGKDCPKIFHMQLKSLGWIALGLIISFLILIFLPNIGSLFVTRDLINKNNRYIFIIIISVIIPSYKNIPIFLNTLKIQKTFINVYNDRLEGVALNESSLVHFNITYKQIINSGVDFNKNELKIRTEDLLYLCYAKNPYEIEEIIISKTENSNNSNDD